MRDYWVGGGCSAHQFRRQRFYDEYIQQRHSFLERANAPKEVLLPEGRKFTVQDWPFVHSVYPMKFANRKYEEEIDPLMVSLVTHMNTMQDVETIACCQGYNYAAPYVFFYATMEAALAVSLLIDDWKKKFNCRYYWNNCIVNLAGLTNEEDDQPLRMSWYLQFYDTLALVQFTKEYLNVPITDQIAIHPEFQKRIGDYVTNPIPIEEWEKILTYERRSP